MKYLFDRENASTVVPLLSFKKKAEGKEEEPPSYSSCTVHRIVILPTIDRLVEHKTYLESSTLGIAGGVACASFSVEVSKKSINGLRPCLPSSSFFFLLLTETRRVGARSTCYPTPITNIVRSLFPHILTHSHSHT